jgi:hypothetical protein
MNQQSKQPPSDDPLMGQADTLVAAAHTAGGAALAPLQGQFAFLKKLIATPEDRRWWDILLTIACVYIAATRLRNLDLGAARETKLMARVSERLTELNPNAQEAFEDCKEFFTTTYEALSTAGHEARFVASDSIGLWIASNLLDRPPESPEELTFVRSVGAVVTHGFFRWWDKK